MRTTRHTVDLPPARTAVTAATWGQRMMWHWIDGAGPGSERFTIAQVMAIPTGVSLDRVLDAIREVTMRHESLRTRHLLDEHGELVQELLSLPGLDIEVCDVAGDEELGRALGELATRLSTTTFDPAAERQFQVVVVTIRDAPVQLLLALSHLAVDLQSSRVIVRELTALLDGAAVESLPQVRQPIEHAEFERSEHGRRTGTRALAYWRSQLEAAPPSMFATEQAPAADRYWFGVLNSRAVGLAANVLAHRHNASTSTVLLAATAILLGKQTGRSRCVLRLNAGNRAGPDLRHAVGVLSQDVPATIDLSGPTFGDVVRQAWAASVRAYRHAHYEWPRVEELVREISERRGVDFDLSCFFNDLRSDTAPNGSTVDIEEIELARTETTFGWMGSWPNDVLQFRLHLADGGDRTIVGVLVDTCVLTRDDGHALATGLESLLVEEAAADR